MTPPEPSRRKDDSSPVRGRPPVIVVLIVLIAILWGGYWLFQQFVTPEPVGPGPEQHAGVGSRLEYLELQPLTGDASVISLPDLLGRVTMVNFWGTWCPPCRDELPHLAELRKRYAGHKAFRLLPISYPPNGQSGDLQSLREETTSLLKRLNLDLPTYWDPNEETVIMLDRLIGFGGFPTTILLDRHRAIRAVWVGYRPGVETEMERHIGMLLEETEEPAL